MEERDIVTYCDLHGHSRRQNVFIYGCENRGNANKRLRERIFPCMLNKNAPDKVEFVINTQLHSNYLFSLILMNASLKYKSQRKVQEEL